MLKPLKLTAVIVLAFALGATSGLAQQSKTAALVPLDEIYDRQILVEYSPGAARSASAFFGDKGVSHVRSMPLSYTTFDIVRVPDGADYHAVLAEIQSDPAVASAGPNVIKHVSEFVPNDPLFLNNAADTEAGLTDPFAKNNQYALLLSGAQHAWETTTGNPNVVVAVLDTGARLTHEDLKNRLWINTDEVPGNGIDDDGNGFIDDVNGWNFEGWSTSSGSGGDNDPSDPVSGNSSHGTATASIIGAQGNNGIGISGVAGGNSQASGVRLMILRVGTNSNITVDAEIGAIDYAIANGAKVISMSFGGFSGGAPEENAVDRAWDAGIFVVAAAGNIGAGNKSGDTWLVDLPAGFDNCVAVGATTIFSSQSVGGSTQIVEEVLANYSKTGPELEISAPGTHILASANTDDGYTNSVPLQFTGTSAATPVVAGLAALLLSADFEDNGSFNLTPDQVRDKLNSTVLDLGAPGRDVQFGFGRIQMAQALDVDPNVVPGDTNGDGVVTVDDLQPIIDSFGARNGNANYEARIDTNGDGVIDELDVLEVARNIGS